MRDYLVTVCDACLRASCWHYDFPCDRVVEAGTREIPASELRKLGKEHESHFSREMIVRVRGSVREIIA